MKSSPNMVIFDRNGRISGSSEGFGETAVELGFKLFSDGTPKRFGKRRLRGVVTNIFDGYETLYFYDNLINSDVTVVFAESDEYGAMRDEAESYYSVFDSLANPKDSESSIKAFQRAFMNCALVSEAITPKKSTKYDVVFLSDAVEAVNGEYVKLSGGNSPPIKLEILPPLSAALGFEAASDTAVAFISSLTRIMSRGKESPEICLFAERQGDYVILSARTKVDGEISVTRRNSAVEILSAGGYGSDAYVFSRLCGALGFSPEFDSDGEFLSVRTKYRLTKQLAGVKAPKLISPERVGIIADFIL